MNKLKQKFLAWRVRLAYNFLRSKGFVPIERIQLLNAQAFLYNMENRAKKLGGGNASKYKVAERNKKLRRLARGFREYLAVMDKGAPNV